MYDVIVVGARCAGASAALLFARAGYRVLLLDRMRFPSDVICTHLIQWPGLELLDQWGLLDPLRRTGCPPMTKLTWQIGDVRVAGDIPVTGGISAAYAPRRYMLDQLLAEAAVKAGAEFRDGCTVTGMLFEEGRVVGVRCRDHRGGAGTERARLVIGADGVRSSVATLVGAATQIQASAMTCAYYAYWPDLATDLEIYEQPGRGIGAFRTHDGLTLVAAYFPREEFHDIRQDSWAAYLAAIRTTAPALAARLPVSHQAGRLRGTAVQPNYFRRPHGPGWVLVGDSGHNKDSITGTGISDAFQQAALLMDCVGGDLHDDTALTSALNRFAAERDLLFTESYQETLLAARLVVSADRLAMMRWVRSDSDLTARFIKIALSIAESPRPAEVVEP